MSLKYTSRTAFFNAIASAHRKWNASNPVTKAAA